MTNIKIAREDLAEADRLEAQAMQTDDPDEAAGLMLEVGGGRRAQGRSLLDIALISNTMMSREIFVK